MAADDVIGRYGNVGRCGGGGRGVSRKVSSCVEGDCGKGVGVESGYVFLGK